MHTKLKCCYLIKISILNKNRLTNNVDNHVMKPYLKTEMTRMKASKQNCNYAKQVFIEY